MTAVLRVLLWCLPMFSAAQAAEPPPAAREEVQHLLNRLEVSGCEFFRNGQWHGGAQAKSHLERKYGYLVRRNLVRTAEDFIRLAATSSSASGKAYQVRCKGADALPSAAWLGDELSRYRTKKGPGGPAR